MSFLNILLGAIAYGAEVRVALAQPERRGTELGAKIYIVELGCVTTKLV
jgi:hypothetical protein